MAEKQVGRVANYLSNIGVAVVEVTAPFSDKDSLHIVGGTTDHVEDAPLSMQVEGEQIKEVKKGDDIGLKVSKKVRKDNKVFIAE